MRRVQPVVASTVGALGAAQRGALLRAIGAIHQPHDPRQADDHALLQAADGIPFLPERFQQFLEVGRIFAEGAHRHLLRLRVVTKTPEGGADALAALVRHRSIAKLLVPPIRGHFLLGHFGFLTSDMENLQRAVVSG